MSSSTLGDVSTSTVTTAVAARPVQGAGYDSVGAVGRFTAQAVLVAAPLLAFNALRTPGIVTGALIIPLVVMLVAYSRTRGLPRPTWELVLLALLLASVAWSAEPTYAVSRLRTFIPLTLSTAVAGCLVPPRLVLRSVKISFAIIGITSLLVLYLNPATRSRAATGSLVVFHAQFAKNQYGALLAFALVLLLSRVTKLHLALVVPTVVLMALNRSVTAWIVSAVIALVALTTAYVFRRFPPGTARPVALTGLLVSSGAVALLLPLFSVQALLAVGKNSTLSSRTDIWAACWEQIVKSPFLGYGAYSFVDIASSSPTTQAVDAHFTNKYRPPHPHNGLLDVLGQIGVVGVVVFVMLIGTAVWVARRPAQLGVESARAALLGLLCILLSGLTEPRYLGPWLVLIFCCTAMARREPGDPGGVGPVVRHQRAP